MSTIAAVLAATPSPSPSGVPDVDVTPGVAGFVAIAVVAIVTILLVLDMTRRIRRTRYRAEVRERLEAEVAGERPDGAATDDPARRAAEDGRADVGDDTERG
ncbi:hypothetical protein [Curtobacterium sp. MCBD17_032]|uniref:hypothetical protein n=1 Tax=Curtobacterium sp. MCBD17_032 TaxID=2175659 RepID=UPI000DA82235|nr:hypothetical protein [Curtobacterium sp. MCBD17_032]PZE86466.1 hypothetical protein DEI91_05135 [Curtobacterium sp. MCBD17_032]